MGKVRQRSSIKQSHGRPDCRTPMASCEFRRTEEGLVVGDDRRSWSSRRTDLPNEVATPGPAVRVELTRRSSLVIDWPPRSRRTSHSVADAPPMVAAFPLADDKRNPEVTHGTTNLVDVHLTQGVNDLKAACDVDVATAN